MVSADVWAAIAAADFARRGILPIAGGSFDQAAGAMAAIRLVWDREAPYRAECELPE